jgi:hypothetical protein
MESSRSPPGISGFTSPVPGWTRTSGLLIGPTSTEPLVLHACIASLTSRGVTRRQSCLLAPSAIFPSLPAYPSAPTTESPSTTIRDTRAACGTLSAGPIARNAAPARTSDASAASAIATSVRGRDTAASLGPSCGGTSGLATVSGGRSPGCLFPRHAPLETTRLGSRAARRTTNMQKKAAKPILASRFIRESSEQFWPRSCRIDYRRGQSQYPVFVLCTDSVRRQQH